MVVVYKYQVGFASHGDNITPIEVPKGSKFLKVAMQDGLLYAWYLVDTSKKTTDKYTWFQIGTGHPFTYSVDEMHKKYIDSIIVEEYGLVWHMFVEKTKD